MSVQADNASSAATAAIVATQPPRRALRRLTRDRNGVVGACILALLIGVALLARLGAFPHDPITQHPLDRLLAPSGRYWLGTDEFGRDLFARTASGVALSLQTAAVAVSLAAVVGSVLGIVAGYAGGLLDGAIGRLTDTLFAFPAILLALAVVAGLGPGWWHTSLAIAVVYTPIFVRVARAPVLSVKNAEYVAAGRILGYSHSRLLIRHVLPNVAPPIAIQTALAMSWAILTESALSFLGLGIQPPQASLGVMVESSRNLLSQAPWTLLAPASAIALAVIGLNLLGDGLVTVLRPRDGHR